ncbi:hypothetical protein [Capnocytophaga felis]|uniref:Tetratricopeptide repeat protein n=1 Tax=Capnocytophaga felis TaxID=2267611 RepID=A0A5M4BAN1_9FLAO|nr:hypothetical protein [Capnocytophaga felis]GET46305.1 hypothetical protein RCZ01_16070 [Capnocytophaga felis]GET48135.1 hypothetical protein RCZ02_09660 [Capnocytophaga felis]
MNQKFRNIILAVSLSFFGMNLQAQNTQQSEIHSVENQFTLGGIQQKIEKYLGEAFATKNGLPLEKLEKQLSENKENNQWNLYWKSYLHFYQTIFYLKIGDKEKASEYNRKSIDVLQDKKDKNAEDYALLANNWNLSFVFMKNQIEAMQIDAEIRENLQKGFRLERENPRLYYVEGNYDTHIPKQYGGGKKAETSLLKAISLAEPNQNPDCLPTWGKREAYQSLLKWYSSENQKEKADELQKKFHEKFSEK